MVNLTSPPESLQFTYIDEPFKIHGKNNLSVYMFLVHLYLYSKKGHKTAP